MGSETRQSLLHLLQKNCSPYFFSLLESCTHRMLIQSQGFQSCPSELPSLVSMSPPHHYAYPALAPGNIYINQSGPNVSITAETEDLRQVDYQGRVLGGRCGRLRERDPMSSFLSYRLDNSSFGPGMRFQVIWPFRQWYRQNKYHGLRCGRPWTWTMEIAIRRMVLVCADERTSPHGSGGKETTDQRDP